MCTNLQTLLSKLAVIIDLFKNNQIFFPKLILLNQFLYLFVYCLTLDPLDVICASITRKICFTQKITHSRPNFKYSQVTLKLDTEVIRSGAGLGQKFSYFANRTMLSALYF